MDETKTLGAQKRIDFYGRWALAFFAVFIVLASWLGNSINAGEFGILFLPGVGCAVGFLMACLSCADAALKRIEQLEETQNG